MSPRHLLLSLFLFTAHLGAAEFRFVCLAAGTTTTLDHKLYDRTGEETSVLITKDSDPEALTILSALIDRQVFGTKGVKHHEGAQWEQAIILVGEFTSGIKRTEGGPNKATFYGENYRDFRVSGIKVRFPLSRFASATGGNPIDGPVIIETHFSFASLFPAGISLKDRQIHLDEHAVKRRKAK